MNNIVEFISTVDKDANVRLQRAFDNIFIPSHYCNYRANFDRPIKRLPKTT